MGEVKVKLSLNMPWGFQEVEVPILQENRHMNVVRFSGSPTTIMYSGTHVY
jgi:hypothetical protein